MQLTLKGDYAVRVIVDLAGRPAGALVSTEEVGRRTDVPQAYLSKIIQDLAHAGLVSTRRGMRGGIALLGEPQAITLKQVIEAVEGPIYLNRCLVRPGVCPRDSVCTAHPVWVRIQELIIREFDSVRIADLVDGARDRTVTRTEGASSC